MKKGIFIKAFVFLAVFSLILNFGCKKKEKTFSGILCNELKAPITLCSRLSL